MTTNNDNIFRPSETLTLGWLDKRDNTVNQAGVSFYNSNYGEYLLKIDEEPSEKQYFLKPYSSSGDKVEYRMEQVIKKKDGTFLKRQLVGQGYSDESTGGNVHVNYGSKYKTLVLFLSN